MLLFTNTICNVLHCSVCWSVATCFVVFVLYTMFHGCLSFLSGGCLAYLFILYFNSNVGSV